jgi:predicted tellurium resistance membrane protein TerC
VGALLVGEAFDQHIDKGYVYFAMAFSMGVEVLHMRSQKKARAAGWLTAEYSRPKLAVRGRDGRGRERVR